MNPARPAAPAALAPLPPIDFPDALPVSARRDEIEQAIAAHKVVIVCGETGSGKTTQLPKIALQMGRGRTRDERGRGPLVGHTQPRRIAASTVAKRIAEELRTPLGEVVGYKVRFQDRVAPGAMVKLMTDGILLAETQGDPLLSAYDTLIIDEAHERSLNIDFLLGYLKSLLPRRPDLKLIVTSATIDADRFARHFASAAGDAPVIQVSGRLFPVEQRWRPFEDGRDHGLDHAIADAVDELWREPAAGGASDILVFLPGEREIRDATDHLRKHLASTHESRRGPVEILPLYARLSQAEQERVFHPGGARRIVLATNVAETSLTVPGIRYVVDSGLARVKRYGYRSKVEQLQVEPISQAAANQRAGRCGRVANGICIRLYDEAGFAARPRFSDPEILRSSLAGVILRMKALKLGAVEDFPFIDAPPRRAIADGYALLGELGAVDEGYELTAMGRELARLPLDPRIGRMILEARERHALAEVLVIASALSGQDVRDRPLEAQAAADQKQKPFDDEKSEFMGLLKLWRWIEAGRGHGAAPGESASAAPLPAEAMGRSTGVDLAPGGRPRRAAAAANSTAASRGPATPTPPRGSASPRPVPSAAMAGPAVHKLSNRQQEQRLREHFISPRRVREWRDIHSQLHTVVAEHGWRLDDAPATYEQVHLSLLAGLLGNIGAKSEDDDWYLGARGIRFWRHPGAHLSKKPGRWIVAAELVETTRLYARGIAAIDPAWLPALAVHLLKKQLLEPHWEKKAAQVVALERATLYGLVVYHNRRVDYAQVDRPAAREIFIREALVAGDWDTRLPFLEHNRKLIRQVEELEHKSRRQDVLVDEGLIFTFYDRQVPAEIASGTAFERWYREAARREPRLLMLTREELMRHEAAGITTEAFPKLVRLGGIDCAAAYLHAPGDPKDGVTVTVPLYALNQVSEARCEWLVPGLLKDKVVALARSLPQRPRSRLVPLPEFAAGFVSGVPFGDGELLDALLGAVRETSGLAVSRNDFKLEQLPPHLRMNLRVVDEHGRQIGMGRNVAALKAELGPKARSAFQALAAAKVARQTEAPPGPAGLPGGSRDGRGASASAAAVAGAIGDARGGAAASARAAAGAGAAAAGKAGSAIPPPDAAPPGGQAGVGADARYTAWSFGVLPELMQINANLVGFPALVDHGDHVRIEVFDEPQVAQARHRIGVRRLFALQLKEPLKALEKNLAAELRRMGAAYMGLGSQEELRAQIVEAALDRAFLAQPLPTDPQGFASRLAEGRPRLALLAQEFARTAEAVLAEFAAATRKLRDSQAPKEVAEDIQAQLARLVPKRFVAVTPSAQLPHLVRYLKAVQLRLDKLRTDRERDASRMAEIRPLEQRYGRLLAERRGAPDAGLEAFRWLLEELRVSLFAQELKTPQPVSAKRLERAWQQLVGA